jgi:hypothetical protein
MATLTLTDVLKRTTRCVEAEIDGEIIALNHETGSCFGLDRVATEIWMSIAEPRSIGEICTRLLGQYEVDRATCESQVINLLEELRAEGMIEACGTAASTAPSHMAV